MSEFALSTSLPAYLADVQRRVEEVARGFGLDFFPIAFEMLTYDQMNEVAAYGGFPNRYPHWRFGMEYEQLSKSYTYGLSKIYEMVINSNPASAYLLEGNSLVDQKLVMAHVCAHVDFFKNNFAFRVTDLDAAGRIDPVAAPAGYDPDRRWIDKMANHGSRVRRLAGRHGIEKVEALVDTCLSLENLIDPWAPFAGRPVPASPDEEPAAIEVPRLRSKGYMEAFINPVEYLDAQRKRLEGERAQAKRFPERPARDVLGFLLAHAPLERWEHEVLEVVREEALYFFPQMQTKIMNEGWASYWHSKIMTERLLDASEIVDYADHNAGVLAVSGGRLNPYKLGLELYRHIEERWNRGQFGREWEACDSLEQKRDWDLRLGLGRQKLFEVRRLYTDVTFIDEFLTPEFCLQQGLFSFGWSGRAERFEIESREFRAVKDKLLAQLTNAGNPVVRVDDANGDNRGELVLVHEHQGVDLRADWAVETLRAVVRLWKRPATLRTVADGKPTTLRFDGAEHVATVGRA